MICQECNEHEASLHLTMTINGEKSTQHLCEGCAIKRGIFKGSSSEAIWLNNLLTTFMTNELQKEEKKKEVLHLYEKSCSSCGMPLSKFKEYGKFGCSECYECFEIYLTPLLKRLHGGNCEHKGKIPKTLNSNFDMKRELNKLKKELERLIEEEEFEHAALLRDEIRLLQQKIDM